MNTPPNEPMPPKAAHCIWMDARVVGYKLCDRDFQCDECPFDVVMRQPFPKPESDSDAGTPEPGHEGPPRIPQSYQEQFEDVLNSFFFPLQSKPFPGDRIFHKGHTWVRKCSDNHVRIGIDHIGAGFLDSLVTIVLPQRKSHLTENTPFCWLVHPEGTITIHAPLSGSVMESNALLVLHPELMLGDPYEHGWIARVQPDEPEFRSGDFLTTDKVALDVFLRLQSLRREIVERCRQTVSVGPTLPDGGVAIETLGELVGRKMLLQIVIRMFRL